MKKIIYIAAIIFIFGCSEKIYVHKSQDYPKELVLSFKFEENDTIYYVEKSNHFFTNEWETYVITNARDRFKVGDTLVAKKTIFPNFIKYRKK
jgi:hypothetical protein